MSALLEYLSHLSDHTRLFLACSGGRDSLSLAWACHLLYQNGKLPALPTLLHVHHGMQSANDDWAVFVKSWADSHGFICHVLPVNLDKKNEAAARVARYQAMMGVMSDGDILLLAHHQNDQAETLLMRLINGTGMQGLSGMKAWQNKTINGKTILLHRPWLSVSRQDISGFAHAHALPYVDDPTNDTSDNTRSFIRNDILPRLATLNPQVCANIARTATLISQAYDIIRPVITNALHACLVHSQSDTPYQSVLDIGTLMTFDTPHQSAILHTWLSMGETTPPTSQTVSDVLTLAHRTDPDQHTQIFWQASRGYVICRYRGHLYRFWDKAWAYLHGQCMDSTIMLAVPDGAYPLDRTDKVAINIHGTIRHLHGKKLYQTLGVAPFFRRHLYTIKSKDGLYLVAPYQSWQLSGTPQKIDGLSWAQIILP